MTTDDLFWVVVLFAASWVVSKIWFASKVSEVEQKAKERLAEIIRPVKIEHTNDIMYWFDRETNQFLAQGKTQQEISAILKQRFPKLIFVNEEKEEILAGPDFQATTLEKFLEEKARNILS